MGRARSARTAGGHAGRDAQALGELPLRRVEHQQQQQQQLLTLKRPM
jgi:hypothetical protein